MKQNRTSQSGVAMLTVTLLLLISATSFTFFSVKSRLMETKIAANDYRYREAFINAETGMEHAYSLMNSKNWIKATGLTKTNLGSGRMKYELSDGSNRFDLAIEQMCVNCDVVKVTSKGYGDNKNNSKLISRVAIAKVGVDKIDSPLLAAGSLLMKGSVKVDGEYNHSPEPAVHSIQTGGPVLNIHGSSSLTPVGTSKTSVDTLRGDNFKAFLGVEETKWTEVYNDTKVIKITSCADIDSKIASAPKPKTFWINGDCELTASAGSVSDPITLIVQDGAISGSANFFGLLYAFDSTNVPGGNSQATLDVDLNAQIQGALIFDYKYTFGLETAIDVIYRSDLIEDRYNSDAASAYWLPGGWSDFDA